MIESVFYVLDLLFAQMLKVAAFRNVLPNKPVCILVDTSLPRTIGVAEVVVASKFRAYDFMPCKLQTVITCDCVQISSKEKYKNRGQEKKIEK